MRTEGHTAFQFYITEDVWVVSYLCVASCLNVFPIHCSFQQSITESRNYTDLLKNLTV